MTPRSARWPATGLAGLVLAGSLAGCSASDSAEPEAAPARPSPVALDAADVPAGLAVGVVVSLTSAPGEGSGWSGPAEGARVAAYRYGLGDVDVRVRAVDDKGTAKGAAAAVRTLVEDDVAGIVLATEGAHVQAALATAAEAGVPVLLPYETDARDLADGAWLTGPDREQVVSTLATALASDKLVRPVLVDAGGGRPAGISTVSGHRFRAGGDVARTAAAIAKQVRSGTVDSVLVTGPAQLQATVVRGLQGANVQVPVLLTPDALSPTFPTTLADLDGTLSGSLTTAGPDAGDVAAMGSGEEGEALSAYFAALRATAGDPGVTDFFDDEPFATVSDVADTRSHDAVVALVTAAAAAGSATPTDVADALAGLRVTHADGLAGPGLDFTSPSALADDDVLVLQASTQGPGLRPVATKQEPQLFWFTASND